MYKGNPKMESGYTSSQEFYGSETSCDSPVKMESTTFACRSSIVLFHITHVHRAYGRAARPTTPTDKKANGYGGLW